MSAKAWRICWARKDPLPPLSRVPLRSLDTTWFELRQYLHDMHDRLQAL